MYLCKPDIVQIISYTILKKKSNYDVLLATVQIHWSSCVVAYSLVYLALTGVGEGGKIISDSLYSSRFPGRSGNSVGQLSSHNPVSIKSRLSLLLLRLVPATTTVSGFYKQSTFICAKSIGHHIHQELLLGNLEEITCIYFKLLPGTQNQEAMEKRRAYSQLLLQMWVNILPHSLQTTQLSNLIRQRKTQKVKAKAVKMSL